jgi:hypothetical protein
MSHLCHWSLAWYLKMVLCWRDYAVDNLVDSYNCKAAAKEFQMAVEAAARFWEAPQNLCIIELQVPSHIGSSLCTLL